MNWREKLRFWWRKNKCRFLGGHAFVETESALASAFLGEFECRRCGAFGRAVKGVVAKSEFQTLGGIDRTQNPWWRNAK